MSVAASTRDDRIELRATKEEKRILVAAAAHERLDVTSFIMRLALPAAREVVDQAERIVLSKRDSERVLNLLENPPSRRERCSKQQRAVISAGDSQHCLARRTDRQAS